MLKVKLFAFIVLGVISTACKDDENALKNLFEVDNTNIKPILKLEESVDLVLKNIENKTIDSTIYFINNVKVGTVKGNTKLHFELKDQKLGNQTIKALVYFEEKNVEISSGFSIFATASPTRPAPANSSRVGTQQRYVVVAVRCRSLATF